MPENSNPNVLLERWRQTLARLGDAVALRSVTGEGLRTFSGIDAEALRLGDALAGLPPGTVVAVQIGNSPSWPAALLALWRAQLIVLPLGRHMESADLDSALSVCHVGAIWEAATPGGDTGLSLRLRDGVAIPNWEGPVPDLLKLTSGTTALPRAVRFRAHQLLADCENICRAMGITGNDLNFGVIPFSHSYGFSNLITPLLALGVPMVASEDRMPRAILHGLQASRATVFPGMPIFYQKLLELEGRPGLPALRLCISAGAPLPKALAERFKTQLALNIHTFYGASECGGIAYDRLGLAFQDGYVGTPLDGVTIRPRIGPSPVRIEVCSAAVADDYYPSDADEDLKDSRFLASDLIEFLPEGMQIVGRVSDVINVAGRKLNPLELEGSIAGCPGVKQVIVFGVLSPLRGEEPIACVAGLPGVTRSEIRQYCQTRISPWMRPRDIWLVQEIPVNERGKISRRALAARYAARSTGSP